MKHIVGVADMKLSSHSGDTIVAYAIGSSLGIVMHDPVAIVGGLLHIMLPNSNVNPEKASLNPYMFVDTGIPLFLEELSAAGATKDRLTVKVAGAASAGSSADDIFSIGKRNYVMLQNLLSANNISIANEDVGGKISRTLHLDINTGRTWLKSHGKEWEL